MNKITELAVILSHADTPEKIEALIECIDSVKALNLPILISTHIKIPLHIVEMVDFIVFDRNNEMINDDDDSEIEVGTYEYIKTPEFILKRNYKNHAFTVLKLMNNAVSLAFSNGFDICHMIHYDCIIKDKNLLKKHYNSLIENDIHYYNYTEYPHRMDSNLFSTRTDRFFYSFLEYKRKKNYIKKGIAILESFLLYVATENNLKLLSEDIDVLKKNNIVDKIKSFNYGFVKNYQNHKTRTATYLAKDKNNFYVVIYTDDEMVSKVEIVIDGNSHSLGLTNSLINVIKINKLSSEGINCYFPDLEHTEIIDNSWTISQCEIIDYNLINFYNLSN